MSQPKTWLAALAVAIAMSIVWGDDDGAALVAEDHTEAIETAQAAARHDAIIATWSAARGARDAQ